MRFAPNHLLRPQPVTQPTKRAPFAFFTCGYARRRPPYAPNSWRRHLGSDRARRGSSISNASRALLELNRLSRGRSAGVGYSLVPNPGDRPPEPRGKPHDLAGEIAPGSAVRPGDMEDAAKPRVIGRIEHALGHHKDRFGEVGRIGRIALLVVDDLDRVAGAGEMQHRLDEVRAARAVEPGGAQDGVIGIGGADGGFASELGAAIGGARLGCVVLAVRAGLAAAEDVVGRDMDERQATVAAATAPGATGVDGKSVARCRSRQRRRRCRQPR